MARARCDEEYREDPSPTEETHLPLVALLAALHLGEECLLRLEGRFGAGRDTHRLLRCRALGVRYPVHAWQSLARRIGVEEVACRQSMGQKNTALTLWLCITFMHPLVAPGIAGYIAWQNFFLTYYMNRRSRLKG